MGGFAVGGLGYLLYSRKLGEVASRKVAYADLGNTDDKVEERLLRADLLLACVVEVDYTRRNKLL